MPRVFVHGNPETAAIWRSLVQALAERGVSDVVLLSPPGFGAPAADDWPATQRAYHDWLAAALEALGGGVDLVGHDWGAGHLLGIAADRPDLLRSWATDCAGLVHPDYVWHDMAQVWQTPGAGEQAVDAMLGGAVEQRSALLQGLGMPADTAADVAAAQDATMARCILALYRSAAQPAMAELGARLYAAERRPGLVLVPTEDPYAGTPETSREVAEGAGAATLTLEGLGHWWMFDGAATVADALVAHWRAADD